MRFGAWGVLFAAGLLPAIVSAFQAPDFAISIAPGTQTVWQANSNSYLITIAGSNGFNGVVSFTASGLPAGATAGFNPPTLTGSGTTTMTVSASPGTPIGSSTLTATGTSGSLSHNTAATLNVVVPPPINYTYDSVGRLTSVTDQYGNSAIYNYDLVGNILSISRQNAGVVTISAFSPASGPVGTNVTILGSGFSATLNQNAVQFNGVTATVLSASNTLLTVSVPVGATTGLITVSVSGGSPVSSSSPFTVTATPGAPTITSFTPTIVAQGVGVTINGTNFSTNLANNTLKVAATTLPVQGATGTTLSTSAPLISGSGHITVQTLYGQAVSADDLFFVASPYTEANVALATRATVGTPVVATLTATKTVAIIVFEGTQGQKARLLFNTSQNPRAMIYDPTGAVLMPDTFIANPGTAIIDTPTFGTTGTYTLYITDGGAEGMVNFTLATPAAGGDFSLSAIPEFYQNYPTGPAFKVLVNAGTGLSGSVQFTTSNLPACATPSFNPTQLSSSGSSRLTFTFNNCSAGSYPFTITGTWGTLVRSTTATLNVNPLPAGWSEGNINTDIGYAEYSNGTFTVNGGSGPYGPNDVSHFVYQSLNGDGSIVARVVSLYTAPSSQHAYGGVMIRQDLTTGSGAKLLNLRLDNLAGAELLWQPPLDGGAASSLNVPNISPPYWLKISRQGDTLVAFVAPDGTNWAQVGSATTISMTNPVLIGLTAANSNQGAVAQIVFDNVTITTSADFNLTEAPSAQSVVPGGTANYTASIGALSGFSGTVTFSVSGVPAGATATFTPTSVSGSGSSTLTVVTSGSTSVGSYPLTITATSGALSHSMSATLTVSNADFSISASPSSQTVNVSGNTTYTLTVAALNGFTGSVGLSVTGLPSGTTASINPNSVTGNGTATVSVTVGPNTPQRTYPLTFVGTSGSLTHTATASLVIVATDFSMSLDTGWMLYPASGGPASRVLTITPLNGFTKTITLSATGLPPGSTASFNPATITASGTSTVTVTTPAGLTPGLLTANIVGTVIDTAAGNPSRSIPFSLITQPGGALPSPWANQDIGSVGIAGSSGYSNGSFTVQSSGLGIGGTSDQFQFLYQPMTGDGTIIARLVSLQNPTGNSRAGVMIRETFAGNSAYALMGFQGLPDSGGNRETNFYARSSTGGSTTSSSGTNGPTTPVWLKLTRQGSAFTGWYSTDGFSWTQQSAGWTTTIPMASTVYVGIAVGDDRNDAAKTAVFDSVTITGSGADFYIVPTPFVRTVSSNPNSSYDSLRIVGLNGFTGTTSFSAASLPGGITASVSPASLSGPGSAVLTLTSAGGTSPGTYPFTLTATSGSLSHVANLNVVVDAAAPAPPAPWASEDLGSPTLAGSTTFGNGTITMQAGGSSLGTADSFRFTYQPLTGDGTIIARIDSSPATHDDARAGVMIRETLEPGSANAFLGDLRNLFTTYNVFAYRLASNATTGVTGNSVILTRPYWAKLVRSGTTITAYVSQDGIYWNSVGSQTIPMSPTVFVGVAVSSASTTDYGTGGFSSISPTNAPDYYLSLVPSGQSAPNGGAKTYYSVILNAINGFNGAVSYSTAGLPSGASATFGSGSSPTLTITTDGTVVPGTYPFTVTGTSGALSHNTSGTLIVNPGTANTLPSPWSNAEFEGAVSGTGASYANGIFSATGAGCCITTSSSDSGQFIYQPLSGDGVIVAQINQNGGTAGLMIRETLDPTSLFAFMGQTSGDFKWFAERDTRGAATTRTQGSSASVPFWAKLQRQGNTLTGWVSTDGINWGSPIGTATVTMASNVFVGLLISAEGGTATSTFSNVSVANSADFYLTYAPATVPLAGQNATFTINVNTLLGFSGNVTLSASNLPSGAAVSTISPNPVNGGSGSSTLTITTQNTLSGSYPFTITGTSGSLVHSISATLVVKNFTIAIVPSSQTLYKSDSVNYTMTVTGTGGFNSAVSLSVSGTPGHVTPTFNPTSVTPTVNNPVQTATLTMASDSRVSAGTSTLTITGTATPLSHSATSSLVLDTSPAYRVFVGPNSRELNAGSSTTYTVTTSPFNGFTGTISLATTGLPSGTTATFNPTSISGGSGSSTLTVATTRTTAVATTNFTIDTSSTLPTQHSPATLIVDPAPDFIVAPDPNSATVPAGTNATYTINLLPAYTFTSPVTFSVSGLPGGATGSFSPATISSGNGQTTLTVTTSGVSLGNYPFTITGTCNTGPCGASLTHSANMTLTVGTGSDFALTIDSSRDFALPNSSVNRTVTVVPLNSYSGSVNYSISGLPSGVTGTFTPNGQTSATLALTIGAGAVIGDYSVTITGTSGSLTHTVPYTLAVIGSNFSVSASPYQSGEVFIVNDPNWRNAFNITLNPGTGFSSPVTYTLSGQPSCVSTNINTGGQITMIVNASTCTTAQVGHYPVYITALAANGPIHTTAVMDLFLVDYSISVSPTSKTINKGSSDTVTVTVTRTPSNGLGNSIQLGATLTPANSNITTGFSPNPVPYGTANSTMTITVANKPAASGSYTITINATVSGLGSNPVRTATVALTVP